MGRKLYIGNLSYEATDADLQQVFAQAGTCESAAVIIDRSTGQSRGFGFVEMSSDAEAQKAIQQLNGQDLKGRALKVNEAMDKGGSRGGGGGAAMVVATAAALAVVAAGVRGSTLDYV